MMRNVQCPKCGKAHQVDQETYEMMGPDTPCMSCVDRDHISFMQRKAVMLGLTCSPGCICGFGG